MNGKLKVALIGSRALHDDIDPNKQRDIDLLYKVCSRLAILGVGFRSGLASKGLDAIAQHAYSEALINGQAFESQFEVYVGDIKDIHKSKLPNKNLAVVRNPQRIIETEEIASRFHPNWKACSPYAIKQHSRNVHQILGYNLDEPVDAIITWCITKNNLPVGGTATAYKLALNQNIPVINLYDLERAEFIDSIKELLLKHGVIG